MRVMIHACPERMWYVEEFLVPSLEAQGVEKITVWNDEKRRGNLHACMDAFASLEGDCGTWHIQDDVLIARDFAERCRSQASGVVYGFCCPYFLDDPQQTGRVYMEDAWHSFQCVRIPNAWARECAAWFYSGAWRSCPEPDLEALFAANKGDDGFFRNYLLENRGWESAVNLRPNLVEHVDILIGGSVLHPWRDYFARAYYWDDADLVKDLRQRLRIRRQNR